MFDMMDDYCIIVNQSRDEKLATAAKVEQFLTEQGKRFATVVIAANTENEAIPMIPPEAECAIVLGGDGTLIRAATMLQKRDIPILGINTGTLGYLTSVEASEAEWGLARLIRGDYRLEKRMMLSVEIDGEPEDTVLNDVVINRNGISRLLNIAVYVNNSLLDVYSGDGVIVSTPTGSTGYNLSAGGAVVQPEAELIMITPICPHSLTSRGIIVSAADTITIEVRQGKRSQEEEAIATLDGRRAKKLCATEHVTIKRSRYATNLIRMDERTFFEILRSKLGLVERSV